VVKREPPALVTPAAQNQEDTSMDNSPRHSTTVSASVSRAESTAEILDTLRAILVEQRRFNNLVDEFAGVFLNAKFPYGRPTDRWWRR
jgi:hypothetical protein